MNVCVREATRERTVTSPLKNAPQKCAIMGGNVLNMEPLLFVNVQRVLVECFVKSKETFARQNPARMKHFAVASQLAFSVLVCLVFQETDANLT